MDVESWGEQCSDVKTPVLCVFDIAQNDVQVYDHRKLVDEEISPISVSSIRVKPYIIALF